MSDVIQFPKPKVTKPEPPKPTKLLIRWDLVLFAESIPNHHGALLHFAGKEPLSVETPFDVVAEKINFLLNKSMR